MPGELDTAREWIGDWWLPDLPEYKRPGTLRYDPDGGLDLQLHGGFPLRVDDAPARDIVFGAVGHLAITLRGGIRERTLMRNMGVDVQPLYSTHRPTFALIGTHQTSPATLTSLEIRVERLHTWAATGTVAAHSIVSYAAEEQFGTATVRVTPQPALHARVNDMGVRVSYPHTLPEPRSTSRTTVTAIEQSAVLDLTFGSPVTVEECVEYGSRVRDLAGLATMRRNGIISLIAYTPAERPDELNTRDRVEIYWRAPVVAGPETRGFDEREHLFDVNDVALEPFLQKWFTAGWLPDPLSLILGSLYEPRGYLNPQVLTAITAAEALHTELDKSPYIPKTEFSALRRALVDAAPAEHRDWVRRAFSSNGPSLRERLERLVARLPAELLAHVAPEPALWVERATQARNKIAHTGKATDRSAAQLDAVVRVTHAIVVLVLLIELGVSRGRLDRLVVEHSYFTRARKASGLL